MKTIKVSEAIGPVLDWLVAECEGVNSAAFHYSTVWSQGGPIIERECIAVDYSDGDATESGEPYWCASVYCSNARPHAAETPLVAAMRCYVASKLGDEVEVPDELGGGS